LKLKKERLDFDVKKYCVSYGNNGLEIVGRSTNPIQNTVVF